MERDEDTKPEDLKRPEGNSLESNYLLHDIGERYVAELFDDEDLHLEPWGIDMREDDGEDGLIYDDKMDFRVFAPSKDGEDTEGVGDSEVFSGDQLVGLLDVKTKSSPQYMGQFNERHYVEYHGNADEYGVPTYVVMCQIDGDDVVDSFAFNVHGDLYDGVMASSTHGCINRFPDGNGKVVVKHEWRYTIDIPFMDFYAEAEEQSWSADE